MTKKSLDTVAIVRQIRDAQYELLKDKSPEEQIRYFREKSASLMRKLEQGRQQQAATITRQQ